MTQEKSIGTGAADLLRAREALGRAARSSGGEVDPTDGTRVIWDQSGVTVHGELSAPHRAPALTLSLFVQGDDNAVAPTDQAHPYRGTSAPFDSRDLAPIRLRRETRLDRVGEHVGLNRDADVSSFDERVRVESRAGTPVLERVLQNESLRLGALTLLDRGFRTITLYSSVATATCVIAERPVQTLEDLSTTEIARFVDAVRMIAKGLPYRGALGRRKGESILRGLALVVVLVVGATILFQALVWLADVAFFLWPAVDTLPAILGIGFGLVLWLGGLLVTWLVIRLGSRSIRRFLAIGMALLPLLTLGGAALLSAMNCAWDASGSVDRRVRVQRVWKSGNRPTRHYIEVDSWRRAEESLMFRVPRHIHQQLAVGSRLTIRTKAGRLGWEWVEEFSLSTRGRIPSVQRW